VSRVVSCRLGGPVGRPNAQTIDQGTPPKPRREAHPAPRPARQPTAGPAPARRLSTEPSTHCRAQHIMTFHGRTSGTGNRLAAAPKKPANHTSRLSHAASEPIFLRPVETPLSIAGASEALYNTCWPAGFLTADTLAVRIAATGSVRPFPSSPPRKHCCLLEI